MLVTTTSNIEGRIILNYFGIVKAVSQVNDLRGEIDFSKALSEPLDMKLDIDGAIRSIILDAKKLGANAIIGLKLNSGIYNDEEYSRSGSYVIVLGTAVFAEEI
jgi:uncharacterized protein YbjQ (UPF0145 family)